MKQPQSAPEIDPRFHRKIFDHKPFNLSNKPIGISYVENYNGQCGYAELAVDFKIAADILINEIKRTELSNFISTIAHLIRQTLELKEKALLEQTVFYGNKEGETLLRKHNLIDIWHSARTWMNINNYKINEDDRLNTAEWLIKNIHEIDPLGDLFRFGISRKIAFGKQKSYDRVGLNIEVLQKDFNTAYDFLTHWEAVLFRKDISKEMGWEKDPYFDADNFPRKKEEK